jgi:hypothetical protein
MMISLMVEHGQACCIYLFAIKNCGWKGPSSICFFFCVSCWAHAHSHWRAAGTLMCSLTPLSHTNEQSICGGRKYPVYTFVFSARDILSFEGQWFGFWLPSPTNRDNLKHPPTSTAVAPRWESLLAEGTIQTDQCGTTSSEQRERKEGGPSAAISPFCASLGDVRRGAHTCQNSLLDHRYCKLKRNSQSVDQNIYISSVMLICHYFT